MTSELKAAAKNSLTSCDSRFSIGVLFLKLMRTLSPHRGSGFTGLGFRVSGFRGSGFKVGSRGLGFSIPRRLHSILRP